MAQSSPKRDARTQVIEPIKNPTLIPAEAVRLEPHEFQFSLSLVDDQFEAISAGDVDFRPLWSGGTLQLTILQQPTAAGDPLTVRGALSPLSKVTYTKEQRQSLNIPQEASHYAFVYPFCYHDAPTEDQPLSELLRGFLDLGGFAYFSDSSVTTESAPGWARIRSGMRQGAFRLSSAPGRSTAPAKSVERAVSSWLGTYNSLRPCRLLALSNGNTLQFKQHMLNDEDRKFFHELM